MDHALTEQLLADLFDAEITYRSLYPQLKGSFQEMAALSSTTGE